MKGEVRRPRTRAMMDVAVLHTKAAFETSCAQDAPTSCMAYEGSVWNGGTHVTVVVDRMLCRQHATDIPSMARVEVWLYDISGDSPVYLGKERLPANLELLKEPGDVPEASLDAKPFLKN